MSRYMIGMAIVLVALLLLATGCADRPRGSPYAGSGLVGEPAPGAAAGPVTATSGTPSVPAVIGLPPPVDSSATYKIGPGDLLSIEVFKVDELSSKERVNADGDIVLPLIGKVKLDGLTPDQAEKRIAEILAKDYVYDPQVDVFVKEYANMKVTVGGAVKKPGVFPITGATTLTEAMAQAQGLGDLSKKNEVILFRGEPGQSMKAYVIELKKVETGEWPDPLLLSNDKIWVPESGSRIAYAEFKDLLATLRFFVQPWNWTQ